MFSYYTHNPGRTLSKYNIHVLFLQVPGLGNMLEHIFTDDMASGERFFYQMCTYDSRIIFQPTCAVFCDLKSVCVCVTIYGNDVFFCADLTDYPFLYARLFSSVAKFFYVVTMDHYLYFIFLKTSLLSLIFYLLLGQMNQQVTERFLYAAIKTVGMDVQALNLIYPCSHLFLMQLPDATHYSFLQAPTCESWCMSGSH